MGRANRRKKIQKLLRAARQRRQEEEKKLADPETSVGQARCSIKELEDFEASKKMANEEVLVIAPPSSRPLSWFQWITSWLS